MTVLWRLRSPRREAAYASVLAGGPPFTLTFVVAGSLDRAENYDTLDLAIFRADDIKRTLLAEGWTDDDPAS